MKEAIIYVGLVQSLFTVCLLLTRKKIIVSDKIMIACLMVISLRFLAMSLSHHHILFRNADFSIFFIPLTFGPFLYLYSSYHIEGHQVFNKWDLLHFAPFVIILSVYLIFFNKEIQFDEVPYFQRDAYLGARILFGLIFFSSTLIYTIFTFAKIRDFKNTLYKDLNSVASKLKLNWLLFISLLFSALFITYFSVGLYNAITFTKNVDLSFLSVIGLTLLAYSVSYHCIQQPMYYFQINQIEYNQRSDSDRQEIKLRFSEEEARKLISRLHKFMDDSKPYLDPELSLQILSSKLNMTKYDLTYLLNNHMGTNFSSFVNEYRLKEVIDKLKSRDNDYLTIVAIAYDCGFNSKSTFNSLFKQHTGTTPTKFKEQFRLEKYSTN